MAIKVIKHGAKVFKAICPICGCEFEYEYEDILRDYFKQVKCPDCGEFIAHNEYKEVKPVYPTYPDPQPINPLNPHVIWTTPNTNSYDCDKCPNKPDWTKPVVGDTPCTWCKKNVPYCTTTGSTDVDTKIYNTTGVTGNIKFSVDTDTKEK